MYLWKYKSSAVLHMLFLVWNRSKAIVLILIEGLTMMHPLLNGSFAQQMGTEYRNTTMGLKETCPEKFA